MHICIMFFFCANVYLLVPPSPPSSTHTHTQHCTLSQTFQVNKIGLKLRAAIITEVYRKALAVNSATLSKFSTGQVGAACLLVFTVELILYPASLVTCHGEVASYTVYLSGQLDPSPLS